MPGITKPVCLSVQMVRLSIPIGNNIAPNHANIKPKKISLQTHGFIRITSCLNKDKLIVPAPGYILCHVIVGKPPYANYDNFSTNQRIIIEFVIFAIPSETKIHSAFKLAGLIIHT